MSRVNSTLTSIKISKDTSDSTLSCANTQPPIPKITLKRKYGQFYKISKSKRHNNKHSIKTVSKQVSAPTEDPVLDGKSNYSIVPTNILLQDIIAIDSSDEDTFEEEGWKSGKKIPQVIEIDLSSEENETCLNHPRLNQNVLPPQSVISNAPSTKMELVDISSDEDNNNVSEVCGSFAQNRLVDVGEEDVGLTSLQKKKVNRDLTHLSEHMYVIINSRRDYSARILRSERLCLELTSKERTIAEDNYNEIIRVCGHNFTQLFIKMESRFENLKQDSFMLYNFIVYRLFVGINQIDHPSKISLELVKKLMLLLLKQNFHKSLVFEVFNEESAEDSLIEFESAFLDWSFPEAFIPIED